MTTTAEIDIDGYTVPAMINAASHYDSFNDPLAAARDLASKMPKRYALQMHPRAFLAPDSFGLKYTVLELDTQTLAERITVSEKPSHVKLQLRTAGGAGVIGLRSVPEQWFPYRMCNIAVFVIRHRVKQPPNTSLDAVFGLMPWLLFERSLFNDDLSCVRLRGVLRNTEYVGAAEKLIYKSISAPVPLFDLATQPSADDIKCTILLTEVLSFALMWHMTSTALPGDRTFVMNERSFKYFGKAPPRDYLFATKSGFLALRHTVAQLEADKAPVLFVISQLCSAFDFILDSSPPTSLERYACYQTSFVPLANTIAEIVPPGVSDGSVAKLDLRINLLYQLVESGELSTSDADWLNGESDGDECDRNRICLSYRFGGGTHGVFELLVGTDLPPLGSYAIVRNARTYVCNELVIRRCSVAFLRHYLVESAGSDCRGESQWETRLKRAMPSQPRIYEDARETAFDDCSQKTLLHHSIKHLLDRAAFDEFGAKRSTSVPLPNNYNAPYLYGLCKSQQKKSTVQGIAVDPTVQALALLGVAHTDDCHRKHIKIAYESESREATRLALHAQLFAEASHSIDLHGALEDNARKVARADEDYVSRLDDIEDIVENLHGNRVLPLCIDSFSQRLLGGDYLRNDDRKLSYLLLASLQLPELDHRMVLRHILRSTPSSKLGEQYHDVSRFERMAEMAHTRAARGKQKAALDRSTSEMSMEEALSATTVAPSCITMIKDPKNPRCPFETQSRERLVALLCGAGVDVHRAGLIADGALKKERESKNMCRLHLRSVLTHSIDDRLDDETDKSLSYVRHPRDFVHIAARHHLKRREHATAQIRQMQTDPQE